MRHTTSSLKTGHLLLHHHLLLLRNHVVSLHGTTLVLVMETTLVTRMSALTWVSSSVATLIHLALLLVVLGILLLMSVNDLHKSSKDLREVGQVGKFVPLEATGLGGLILFPIGLVLGLLVLKLSQLLDLIVVDDELLAINSVIVQLSFSLGGVSGFLETDKSKCVLALAHVEADVFDFSILLEETLELLFLVAVGEVLDVQVASLLRVLVPDSFTKLLNLTFSLLQSITYDEVDFLVTINELLVVKGFDGLLSALRTIFLVDTSRIIIADECELSDLTRLDDEREDVTVGLEHLLDVILSVRVRDVLDIDVVHELAKLALVVLRLELDNVHAVGGFAV